MALLAGCAKFPATGGAGAGKRLVFTMTVDREISTSRIYIIALRPSSDPNPTDQGPIPVVAPPWGNGMVAGNVTHFVKWDPFQSPRYIINRFRDANLIEYFETGVPINYVDVEPGGRTLRFEIDLTQIASSPVEAAAFESIQVNFLTMDKIPQGTVSTTKLFDALGDSRLPSEINQYITLSLRTARTYTNADFNFLEPQGDTPDPDLDIVDWSVEVRIQ